jgi:NTP pyrophosphatase (non-canonical NTP hydrolase)
MNLESIVHRFHDWQLVTFTQATPISKLKHLEQEVAETIRAIETFDGDEEQISDADIREEFADCFALLFGAALAFGLSVEDIADAMEAKLEKNKKRKWGQPDQNGVVNHIK